MNLAFQTLLQLRDNILGKKFRTWSQVPYMMYREQEVLTEVILRHRPQRVLEWGSGFSTVKFSQLLPSQSEWISIEDDQQWADRIRLLLRGPNAQVIHSTSEDYIQQGTSRGPFDLIIVDGVERISCLQHAIEALTERGVIFLHDANRVEYHRAFPHFEEKFVLTDYRRTAGGLAILSNHIHPNTIINCEKHRKIWGYFQNTLTKVLAI